MGITNMVLRTVYISPSVDDALRDEAFRKRTSKNDLIRQYIELGMEAKKAKQNRNSGATPARPAPAAKKTVAAKKRAGATGARAVARGR